MHPLENWSVRLEVAVFVNGDRDLQMLTSGYAGTVGDRRHDQFSGFHVTAHAGRRTSKANTQQQDP